MEHFYTTRVAAERLGYQQKTIELWARTYPGFATKVGPVKHQVWRIPESSLRQVASGVPLDQLTAA